MSIPPCEDIAALRRRLGKIKEGMVEEIQYVDLLGSRLVRTSYNEWIVFLKSQVSSPSPVAVDFVNTHIVTMRRMDETYREMSRCMDYAVPDSMPLVWCMRAKGANVKDRVYGPAFMKKCLMATPAPLTHYFLGGRKDCLDKLVQTAREFQPEIQIVGHHIGWFSEEEESQIIEEIDEKSPDFIWVGLGTPLQQKWIARNKGKIKRGILLAVGFAFDVNAGTKKDSPEWMQKRGLGWLYRMFSEPFRLGPRYFKYNALFLWYLILEWLGIAVSKK